MPASRDVGTNIKNLRASKTKRPEKEILAIALSEARKMGNKSVKPRFGRGEAKKAINAKAIKEGSPAEERGESKKKEAAERRMGIDKVGKGGARYKVGRGEACNIMHKKVGRGENMPPMGGGGAPPMGGGQTMTLTGPDGKQYQYDPMTGKATPMGGGMPPMGGSPGIGEGLAMRHMRPNQFAAGRPPMGGGVGQMPSMPPAGPGPMLPPGGGRPPMGPPSGPTARPAVQPRPAGRRRATASAGVGAGGAKKSAPKAKSGKK